MRYKRSQDDLRITCNDKRKFAPDSGSAQIFFIAPVFAGAIGRPKCAGARALAAKRAASRPALWSRQLNKTVFRPRRSTFGKARRKNLVWSRKNHPIRTSTFSSYGLLISIPDCGQLYPR
jgi:hypothetical protein